MFSFFIVLQLAIHCVSKLSMNDVTQVIVYVTDRKDLPVFNEIYAEYFNAPYPNRAAIVVAGFGREEMLCEIIAYAAVPQA